MCRIVTFQSISSSYTSPRLRVLHINGCKIDYLNLNLQVTTSEYIS